MNVDSAVLYSVKLHCHQRNQSFLATRPLVIVSDRRDPNQHTQGDRPTNFYFQLNIESKKKKVRSRFEDKSVWFEGQGDRAVILGPIPPPPPPPPNFWYLWYQ